VRRAPDPATESRQSRQSGSRPRSRNWRGPVRWTNQGKAPHSATANDYIFDTGILNTGKSASHTFSSAGTFTYYCVVHPYMKATIVVQGPASTSGSRPAASSGAAGGSTAATHTTKAGGGASSPSASAQVRADWRVHID
jgi:hypothetical protein